MKVNVNFDFYEQRPYIHSTQLLYSLLDVMKQKGYYKDNQDILKVTCIYKIISNKQGYYLIDEAYSGEYNTLFKIQLKDKTITAYYIEYDEMVVNRVPYDEIHIIDGCDIDIINKVANFNIERYDNLYNVIIALGKKLILSVFDSNGYSSWKVGKFVFNWGGELHNHLVLN